MKSQRRTNRHEWPSEHLGTSPSRQDPSTSEEERCQQREYRADACTGGKIRFEPLWKAYPGITISFFFFQRGKNLNDEAIYHASGT